LSLLEGDELAVKNASDHSSTLRMSKGNMNRPPLYTLKKIIRTFGCSNEFSGLL